MNHFEQMLLVMGALGALALLPPIGLFFVAVFAACYFLIKAIATRRAAKQAEQAAIQAAWRKHADNVVKLRRVK